MFEAVVDEDEGLVLRLLEPRHAQALFNLIDQNREHLGTWFPFIGRTKTVKGSEKFIGRGLEQLARGDGFQAGIWLENVLAGCVGPHTFSQQFRSAEISYWLGASYQGRGVMTKTCRYLCAYLFEELNLNRIEIRCSEMNTRSRAIPERLGFTQEGKLRQMSYTKDGLADYVIYGLLADEWRESP